MVAMELTSEHVERLQRMRENGFAIVAFPMYANYVGLRKGICVALVEPIASGHFKLLGQPTMLVGENLGVRIRKNGSEWFVWKQEKLEATPKRMEELKIFTEELAKFLT